MMLKPVMGRLWRVILFWSAFGLLAGLCFGSGNELGKDARPASVFRGAPASAARLQNPYRGDKKAALAGKKLFRRYCASCHGEHAEGREKAPPLRSDAIRDAPDGVLFWFVKNGKVRAGMPSWSGLPPPQRWQIVSFLKSLQK